MFQSALIQEIPYTDPWGAGFDERLGMLTRRHRRVAYYYQQPDTSTFRYRIFNNVHALNTVDGSDISAAWFGQAELPYMEKFIDRADVLVICRTRYTPAVGRMIARAKARGMPVLFDIDDFVFDADYAHLVMHTLDQVTDDESSLDFWFGYFARHGAALRMCDAAIVTNPCLADRVGEAAPDLETRVIPNYLNDAQQALSAELHHAKRYHGYISDDCIHIGYFSGTPTHNKDFAIAASALARLMDRDPRVVLRIVGFAPPHESLTRHRQRIELHPLQDFMNLQRLIAECELNIAPLQNNIFTNCKSELKYFEAAIAGTITLATPTVSFRAAIRDGENGLLAGPHEWEDKLRQAIAIIDNPDGYAAMADRGFMHAEQNYGWDRHVATVETALFG